MNSIEQPIQLKALLASMCTFAATIENHKRPLPIPSDQTSNSNDRCKVGAEGLPGPQQLHILALQLFEDAIRQYGDEPPPLCLLQAAIINTSYSLNHGIHGSSWRSLGLCIQLAYELNLHLTDFQLYQNESSTNLPDLGQWVQEEERRRAWWAIWELDSYASTIRRCPSVLRTGDIQTLLPVPDDMWFQYRYQSSTFLRPKTLNSLRALKTSGNESSLAWLIMTIFLMRDAQLHSNYKGALWLVDQDKQSAVVEASSNDMVHDIPMTEKVWMTINHLKFLESALPDSLKISTVPLTFTSSNPCMIRHVRQQHSAIYNIAMMIEMARYMAHHFFGIQEIESGLALHDDQFMQLDSLLPTSDTDGIGDGVRKCIEAADNIFDIISCSSADQVLYSHPFNANMIALAASVKLVQKTFNASNTDIDMLQLRVAKLRQIIHQFIDVWGVPQALLGNLHYLEERVMSGYLLTKCHEPGCSNDPHKIKG